MNFSELRAFDPEGEVRFLCPMPECQGKEGRSLAVYPDTRRWYCFRCGSVGDLEGAEEAKDERPKRRSAPSELSRAVYWGSGPIAQTPGETALIKRLAGVNFRNYGGVRYRRYLLGGQRIIFPIRDWVGEVIGCEAKAIDEKPRAKVVTVKGSGRGVFPTSADALLADPLIITEAPIDALSLAVLGYPALAIFGTNPPDWLPRLSWFREVLVATDNDEAGDRAERKLRRLPCRSVRRIRPKRKDWNEDLVADSDWLEDYLYAEVGPAVKRLYPHPALEYQRRMISETWKTERMDDRKG